MELKVRSRRLIILIYTSLTDAKFLILGKEFLVYSLEARDGSATSELDYNPKILLQLANHVVTRYASFFWES